ncbi:unnamed protein product, partial [Ceratitis capitata]
MAKSSITGATEVDTTALVSAATEQCASKEYCAISSTSMQRKKPEIAASCKPEFKLCTNGA